MAIVSTHTMLHTTMKATTDSIAAHTQTISGAAVLPYSRAIMSVQHHAATVISTSSAPKLTAVPVMSVFGLLTKGIYQPKQSQQAGLGSLLAIRDYQLRVRGCQSCTKSASCRW